MRERERDREIARWRERDRERERERERDGQRKRERGGEREKSMYGMYPPPHMACILLLRAWRERERRACVCASFPRA
jgi:hypothetical protein